MRYLLMALLLLANGAVSADSLGRFFLAPQERVRLEALRQRIGIDATISRPASAVITLNGLVQRSQGKTTVWVNNIPQRGDESHQGVIVFTAEATPRHIPLKLPNSGRIVVLKAGQTINTANGAIHDAYQRPPPQEQPAAGNTPADRGKAPAATGSRDKE